jgi:hypothetical protein
MKVCGWEDLRHHCLISPACETNVLYSQVLIKSLDIAMVPMAAVFRPQSSTQLGANTPLKGLGVVAYCIEDLHPSSIYGLR